MAYVYWEQPSGADTRGAIWVTSYKDASTTLESWSLILHTSSCGACVRAIRSLMSAQTPRCVRVGASPLVFGYSTHPTFSSSLEFTRAHYNAFIIENVYDILTCSEAM